MGGDDARDDAGGAEPALVRALLKVEWGDEGHAAGCPVDAALTAAGLATQEQRNEARASLTST